ncbi:MAG: hypothetical protein HYT08_02645 [Candidatus Levybacteria bacterium]|nr:hypothetical protein [Candidatus Levybacteria bacterium]
MKKFLPDFRKILPVFLGLLIIIFQFFIFSVSVNAQTPTPTGSVEGQWVKDDEVTFVGKTGARSGEFLDWTLQNYNWSFVTGGQNNPLSSFWADIRNIVYAFFALLVLVTAFVIIVTRGRNITVMKFIPRFIIILLLVTFSFALIQFIYQINDAVQGFFLKSQSPGCVNICQKDLLYIGFDYSSFEGYRKFGSANDESAFISLLLVRLTAITYYVMVGILLLRKIILWFFIVISPVFPLLILYSPIRNTAKIWVGEFFRWLLYAPLFAIFLSGLVAVWRSGIPMKFNFIPNNVIYPTAINILLGGPGQILSLTNSVNNKDTFALYVVALLMLWVVIILPFLLLQIFLDYLNNFSFSENTFIKQVIAGGSSFVNKVTPPPKTPQAPIPPLFQPTGMARPLPYTASKIEIPDLKVSQADIQAQVANVRGTQTTSEILHLANLSVPKMTDIAKYETSLLSRDISRHEQVAKVHETLESIANPRLVALPAQRQHFSLMQERLKQEAQKGDPLASSILSAVNTVSKTRVSASSFERQRETSRLTTVFNKINSLDSVSSLTERAKLNNLKNSLIEAQQRGDPLASSIMTALTSGQSPDETLKEQLMEAKEKGSTLAASVLESADISRAKELGAKSFPVANRIQTVSIDDYESVKKIWQENYQKLEPPKTIEGKERSRKDWLKTDIDKITEIINLLTSADAQRISKGMEAVGAILPFLLIGGFAQTEVIAYLKAKLEAAKDIISEIDKKEEEEETMVDTAKAKEEKPKEMEMQEQKSLSEDEKNNNEETPEENGNP